MRSFTIAGINGDTDATVVAAGTTQATATSCPADHCAVISGTGGVIIKEDSFGALKSVANNSTTVAITVYPWVGAKLNGQTVNLGYVLPPGHAVLYMCMTPTMLTVFA